MGTLKGCPFCGGPILEKIGHGKIEFFLCDAPLCGAVTSFRGATYAENIVRWNARAKTNSRVDASHLLTDDEDETHNWE